MNPDEILKIITDAKALSCSETIPNAAKEIIINVADLAMSNVNAVINNVQNEAERKVSLAAITESFKDSSKQEVLLHLNKVVEAISGIVRAAIKLDNARILSEKMFNNEETKEVDMQIQEDNEADLCDVLIDEIKTLQNGVPEESDSPEKEDNAES